MTKTEVEELERLVDDLRNVDPIDRPAYCQELMQEAANTLELLRKRLPAEPKEPRFEPMGGDVRDDVVLGWACNQCERINYVGLEPQACEGCGAVRTTAGNQP